MTVKQGVLKFGGFSVRSMGVSHAVLSPF